MAGKEDSRIFVGGLSFHTDERKLSDAFRRFGKVVDAQIMLERHTNRHRGFGFVTFSDPRAVEEAISDMHNKELDGRTISVNRAEPKMNTDDTRYTSSGGGGGGGERGDYRAAPKGDGPLPGNCFECGRSGHWARDCPNPGSGRSGGRFPSKFSGGGGGGRGDRFSGSDRFGDRYADDRYDSGRYGYREPIDSRDRYDGGRDRYASDRYPSGGDRFGADRYGAPDRYPPSTGYGRERERSYERDPVRGSGAYDRSGPRGGASYDRDGPRGGIGGGYDRDGPRGGGADTYGSGGPARYDGGSYRERPGPYDRPSRGGGRYEDRF